MPISHLICIEISSSIYIPLDQFEAQTKIKIILSYEKKNLHVLHVFLKDLDETRNSTAKILLKHWMAPYGATRRKP